MRNILSVTYLGFPALIALIPVGIPVYRGRIPAQEIALSGVGGFLFYAAPFLVWLLICRVGKVSVAFWHAGLIAATIALLAICSAWFFPPDLSGLPMQWILYWPLALILQIGAVLVLLLFRRYLHLVQLGRGQSPRRLT